MVDNKDKEEALISKDQQFYLRRKMEYETLRNNYTKKVDTKEIIKKVTKTAFNISQSKDKILKKVVWDNSVMVQNMKFCVPPRFLIVEDNVVGRMGLKTTLKKVGIPSKIDYAANGREAVRKHKNLFDKG
jgi:hypothetical protein